MSYADDWRDRHGPRGSGGRVLVYVILLLVILLIISRAGDFSRTFTAIFLAPEDHPAENAPEQR
jgi:hypothetical protein